MGNDVVENQQQVGLGLRRDEVVDVVKGSSEIEMVTLKN